MTYERHVRLVAVCAAVAVLGFADLSAREIHVAKTGADSAAIKFHQSVDTVIRGNLIRGVFHQQQGAFGIWMDWANQGTRISGNIIYDTQAANIFLEMNHGPTLVDNNACSTVVQNCSSRCQNRRGPQNQSVKGRLPCTE